MNGAAPLIPKILSSIPVNGIVPFELEVSKLFAIFTTPFNSSDAFPELPKLVQPAPLSENEEGADTLGGNKLDNGL